MKSIGTVAVELPGRLQLCDDASESVIGNFCSMNAPLPSEEANYLMGDQDLALHDLILRLKYIRRSIWRLMTFPGGSALRFSVHICWHRVRFGGGMYLDSLARCGTMRVMSCPTHRIFQGTKGRVPLLKCLWYMYFGLSTIECSTSSSSSEESN